MYKVFQTVSAIKTPKAYVELKGKILYPNTEYMRYIADKYYPGWSFKVIKEETIRDNTGKPIFEKVHGRIEFEVDGQTITGDVVAAHRINYTGANKEQLLDPGNDIKAAVTDAWKKALNMYMHICDDIYKWESPVLSDEKKDILFNLTQEAKEDEKGLARKIETMEVNNKNFDEVRRKLEYRIKFNASR